MDIVDLEELREEHAEARRMHIRALKDKLRIEAQMYRLREFQDQVRGLPGMAPEAAQDRQDGAL